MKRAPWLFGLLLLITGVGKTELNPVPGTQSTSLIFGNADLVCSAVVISIATLDQSQKTEANANSRGTAKIDLKVLDCYKGSSPNQPVLQLLYGVETSRRSSAFGPFQPGVTVLLFLKENSGGAYTLADAHSGVTVFTSVTSVTDAPGMPGIARLQTMLSSVLSKDSRTDTLNAIRLIQGLDSITPETVSRMEVLSTSQDPEIALSAFAVLVKTRTPNSLRGLANFLQLHDRADQFISLLSVGSEIERIQDPKELPEIEHLAASRYLSIRLGAVNALRKIKDVSSAPSLVERLDDPNSTIRYLALITLAEIYGKYEGDFAPSMYLFDQKPLYYTDLWKAWWLERGGKP